LTLVEVMISVLLFAILAAGALAALSSQQTTTATQQHASDTLSGARATFDALTKQLRLLKGGAPNGRVFINDTANLPAANASAPFDSGTTNCGNGEVPVIELENSSAGPDAIRILVPEGSTWGSISVAAAGSDTHVQLVTGDAAAPLLAQDDWALISDFTNPGIVFKVGDSSSVTCPADFCLAKTPASAPGWPSPPGTFAPGAFVVGARWLEYSVSTTQFGARLPALMVRDLSDPSTIEPAAMGIEDLQVALWIDDPINGNVGEVDEDGSSADEIIFNNSSDALTPDACELANLRGVRITIVARATSEDRGARLGRPQAEDHAAASTNDGFYRVVMRAMIGLRNE
jgi:type II secretory pathway pseudopilin PulG